MKNILFEIPEDQGKILFNEPLGKYTRFGVGGDAGVLFFPKDATSLSLFLKKLPVKTNFFVLGGGSNLLIRDGGFDGVVIKLSSPYFKRTFIEEDQITCFSGVANSTLKKILVQNQIGGLEFLTSVPGSIGGLVRTNAGCFGKALSDVLLKAQIMDRNGSVICVDPSAFNFSYRSSQFPQDWIIISLSFRKQKCSADQISEIIKKQEAYRKEHQPIHERTAGSTFKNPLGYNAWSLIKDAGCESLKIGGARVSKKHCNFLINENHATAKDIEDLGEEIVKRVKEKTGILLQWEVQRIGVKK